jgi:hypothetical protein
MKAAMKSRPGNRARTWARGVGRTGRAPEKPPIAAPHCVPAYTDGARQRLGMYKIATSLTAGALVVVGGAAVPADGATKTLRDPGTQLTAANNVQHAKMTYAPHRTVYRVKMERLSRSRTQVIVRFYRPSYDLMITTKFVDDQRQVIARRNDNRTFESRRFFRGFRVRWNFNTNVISVVNTRFLSGRSARMQAYAVPKGALHGPVTEPDDFVSARIRRG